MSKIELEQERKELFERIRDIEKELTEIKDAEMAATYGDKYSCEFCAYNAAQGFSDDGWHNTCGSGNCTCCNHRCDEYKPDNEVTLFIKKNINANDSVFRSNNTNGYGHIDTEESDALKELGINIFNIKDKKSAETAIRVLKIIFCKTKK